MSIQEKRRAIWARIEAEDEDDAWLKVVLAQIELALAMGKE